ncbi:hypothetical protein [Streptomyces sp. NPDC093707]|uniref:hypothetical protein n=1 Tax=Streptomyces sp. NPDC093707 TaxID=3154984 RepID=UPI00344E0D69
MKNPVDRIQVPDVRQGRDPADLERRFFPLRSRWKFCESGVCAKPLTDPPGAPPTAW